MMNVVRSRLLPPEPSASQLAVAIGDPRTQEVLARALALVSAKLCIDPLAVAYGAGAESSRSLVTVRSLLVAPGDQLTPGEAAIVRDLDGAGMREVEEARNPCGVTLFAAVRTRTGYPEETGVQCRATEAALGVILAWQLELLPAYLLCSRVDVPWMLDVVQRLR